MKQGMCKKATMLELSVVLKAAKMNLDLVVEVGYVSLAEVKARQWCDVASLALSLEFNKDRAGYQLASWVVCIYLRVKERAAFRASFIQ